MPEDVSKPDSKADAPASDDSLVVIDYIKSNLFRVIHVDGAWGSVTPNGDIHIDLWNARQAIPKRIQLRPDESGDLEVTDSIVRCDYVHEVEVGVVMSVDTARQFRDWLEEQIKEIESHSE